MNIREAHFDNTNRCRVIAGPAGRAYFTTPQALGLALLGMPVAAEDEASVPSGIAWTDYLATHGVAHGIRGNRQLHLVILPTKPRTVTWVGLNDNGTQNITEHLTLTFPPMLACLLLQRGVYERASLFMANMSQQAQMNTGSPTPMLSTFPYGNVYLGTGHICWGGVRTADIRTIKDLDDLFFGTGFNRDLYDGTRAGGVSLRLAARAAVGGILPPVTGDYSITIPSAISHLMTASG